MIRLFSIASLTAVACGALLAFGIGAAPKDLPPPTRDLAEFSSVDRLITTRVTRARPAISLPGYLGVSVKSDPSGSLAVTLVHAASPAARAGVKPGDLLARVDDRVLRSPDELRELLQGKGPGAVVALAIVRENKPIDLRVTLDATSRPMSAANAPNRKGPVEETPSYWLKDQYRLAVIVVDFPDFKHNEAIKPAHWEEALFSRKTYQKTATGQKAHGSLSDYFLEQSYGRFHLGGKAFEPIRATKKRGEYYQGAGGGAAAKTALLTEALDKLIQGSKDALKDVDGLCFIYAGTAVQTNDRGSLYYPHRGSVSFQGKRWPYVICPEGGSTMESISVFAPVFGRLLGLPDLAARTENAGSEGLGVWCLMSNGAGKSGRPGHLSAWCKEQLGWLEPAVIDPTVKQKIVLGPVAQSSKECVKVLVRLDGSEYLLLENRVAVGFDADLPAQGLLIWRVTNGQPTLEEAHGITGPSGPRVHLDSIPYPSKSNNAFTPYTTPSSRSLSGGGLPVFLTNIRRHADGRITFFVGYDYY